MTPLQLADLQIADLQEKIDDLVKNRPPLDGYEAVTTGNGHNGSYELY